MSNNTEAVGLGGLVAPVVTPNPAEIAADKAARSLVNDTMKEVIGDLFRPKSPSLQEEAARRDGPPANRGWVDATPLRSPPGQEIIAHLCNEVLPHGPKSNAGKENP